MDNQSANKQIKLAEQYTDAKHKHLNTASHIKEAVRELQAAAKHASADRTAGLKQSIKTLRGYMEQELIMAKSYDVEVRNLKQTIERLQNGK